MPHGSFHLCFLYSILRVPEQPKDQAVVIDRDTYKRLLNACNYKSKEEREADKELLNKEKDKIIVIFLFLN